ncbi:MAG: GatB/YqeY domain-containing protein, partial [Clostridium sp.]
LGAKDIKDMGKVMSKVNPITKGRADGKLVSQIVKYYLSK